MAAQLKITPKGIQTRPVMCGATPLERLMCARIKGAGGTIDYNAFTRGEKTAIAQLVKQGFVIKIK